MASAPNTSCQIDGETMETVTDFIFLASKITADGDCNHEIKRRLFLGRKPMTNLGSILKSRDITLLTKVHLVKAVVFPVVMFRCESWTIKKAECRRIDAFELWCLRSLVRVPWTARRSNQLILKKNQSWIFIGRTDTEAPILWLPDAKNWLIGKDPDAGKEWRQEEKGTTEDEMVGWHRQPDGYEFEQAPGLGDGQESLRCCSPWGRKESDTTEQLNWTHFKWAKEGMWQLRPHKHPGECVTHCECHIERSRVADMRTCHSSYAMTVLLCFSLLSSSLHTAWKYWQARVESYASLDQSGSLFTECVSIDCLNIGLRIL